MKILTICSSASLDDESLCLKAVFGRLAEEGHEIHAVVPARGPVAEALELRGIRVHVLSPMPRLDRMGQWAGQSRRRKLGALVKSIWALQRLIRSLNVDVVHSNSLALPCPSVAAALTRRAHVWHARELPRSLGVNWHFYQRWVHAGSRTVVAVSEAARSPFEERFRGRVEVVYDGLDAEAACADQLRVQAFRALFAGDAMLVGVGGGMSRNHGGREMLLRAASLLRSRYPQVRYVFAGPPPATLQEQVEERALHGLVSAYGLEDAVTFAGEAEIPECVLAALDLAVVAPVAPQAAALAVLEAMAEETCVLAANVGGLSEQVHDGVTGALFRGADFEDLARLIESLLVDSQRRRRLAAAGKEAVQTRFELDQTVREMRGILTRAIEGK